MKSYSEMLTFDNFGDRLKYLSSKQKVGEQTFGDNRRLNQLLYHDREWRRIRNYVISRDRGCDLAILDLPILDRVYIHHINPISEEDIINRSKKLFDLDNLVCVSFDTHQLIHYGVLEILTSTPVERFKNDTCPWKL